MFSITNNAAKQIQQAASASDATQLALRVAAKIDSDGCLQYGMGFDQPTEADIKLDLAGISVVLTPDSHPLLLDTVLDFVELNPGEFNFIFMSADHPAYADQAPRAAGCVSTGCSGCASGGGCR